MFFVPNISYGSGVVVGPDRIATAAHVVEELDFIVVRYVGDDSFHGAAITALDRSSDAALLQVESTTRPSFSITEPPPSLTPGEVLNVTGYPIDARQLNPAAASGVFSRQTNEGLLELAVALNPGNSGGPVLNAAGQLIGIVTARGRMDRGIQGVALAVPVSRFAALVPNQQSVVTPSVPPQIPWLIDQELSDASDPALIQSSPILAAAVAHREWQSVIGTLIDFRVPSIEQLAPDVRQRVNARIALARRAIAAVTDTETIDEYKLRELAAQLGPEANATGASGLASPRRITGGVALLEVRYPGDDNEEGVGDSAHEIGSHGRFRLRFSMDVPLPLGALPRLTFLASVYRSTRLDMIVGLSVSLGFAFDKCEECFDSSDLSLLTGGLEFGLRGRFGRLFLEASAFLGPTSVNEGSLGNLGPVHLSQGATATLGYKATRGLELLLGYRFQFTRNAVKTGFDDSENLILH
ncbi:MAG: S1C family serine protease, partial [Myxococcota bacterium]